MIAPLIILGEDRATDLDLTRRFDFYSKIARFYNRANLVRHAGWGEWRDEDRVAFLGSFFLLCEKGRAGGYFWYLHFIRGASHPP